MCVQSHHSCDCFLSPQCLWPDLIQPCTKQVMALSKTRDRWPSSQACSVVVCWQHVVVVVVHTPAVWSELWMRDVWWLLKSWRLQTLTCSNQPKWNQWCFFDLNHLILFAFVCCCCHDPTLHFQINATLIHSQLTSNCRCVHYYHHRMLSTNHNTTRLWAGPSITDFGECHHLLRAWLN